MLNCKSILLNESESKVEFTEDTKTLFDEARDFVKLIFPQLQMYMEKLELQ